MPVFDVDKWKSSLKTRFNIPDDDPLFTQELPEVEKGFMRQDEFSRRQQKLDQEHRDRMAKEDQFREALVAKADKLRLMEQLERTYGPADRWSDALQRAISTQHPELGVEAGETFTREEVMNLVKQETAQLRQQIQAVGTGAAVMIDFMDEIPAQWKDLYGTRFPKREFSEFFQKSGLSDPKAAFEIFEKPYLQKHMEEKHKKELEEAEKRGAQSVMSKHGIVDIPPSSTTGNFFKTGVELDPATGQPKKDDSAPSLESTRAKVGSAYQRTLDNINKTGRE